MKPRLTGFLALMAILLVLALFNEANAAEGAIRTWEIAAKSIEADLKKLPSSSLNEALFVYIKAALPQVINGAEVDLKDYPLLVGAETADVDNPRHLPTTNPLCKSERQPEERDAIAFYKAKKIKVNENRIPCYAPGGDELKRLVLKEYLALIGLKDDDGKIADTLMRDIVASRTRKDGVRIFWVRSCEDLRKLGTPVKLAKPDTTLPATRTWVLAGDLDCGGSAPLVGRALERENFDGNGFKIKNLKAAPALFGSICARCTISNLELEEMVVEGSALLAHENKGTITHVKARGTLTTATPVRGGLVALNSGGTIRHAIVEASILAKPSQFASSLNYPVTGGMVGVDDGKIFESIARVAIRGPSAVVGGFVGMTGWQTSIRSATALVDIQSEGTKYLGGFVGIHKSRIESSVVSGQIKLMPSTVNANDGADVAVGGFAGVSIGLEDPKARSSIVDSDSSVSICGKTYAQLKGDPAKKWVVDPSPLVGVAHLSSHSGLTQVHPRVENVRANGNVTDVCE